MGYFYWDGIPRKADDPTRIAAFVAAQLALQDELSELADVNIPAPANGEVLTWDTATSRWIASVAAGAGDLSWSRHLRTGRNHLTPLGQQYWANTVGITAAYIYASAFPIPTQMTFDRIGVYASAGGNARLGIYDDDGNAYPDSLVLDAGIVDLSAPGLKQIGIDQTLSAGLHWLVILPESAGSAIYCSATSYLSSILGFASITDQGGVWYVSQAYGALPATFPGGGSILTRLLHLSFRRSA